MRQEASCWPLSKIDASPRSATPDLPSDDSAVVDAMTAHCERTVRGAVAGGPHFRDLPRASRSPRSHMSLDVPAVSTLLRTSANSATLSNGKSSSTLTAEKTRQLLGGRVVVDVVDVVEALNEGNVKAAARVLSLAENARELRLDLTFARDKLHGGLHAVAWQTFAAALPCTLVRLGLNFAQCTVGDDGARSLAAMIPTHLEHLYLNLKGSGVGDDGMMELTDAVKQGGSFVKLFSAVGGKDVGQVECGAYDTVRHLLPQVAKKLGLTEQDIKLITQNGAALWPDTLLRDIEKQDPDMQMDSAPEDYHYYSSARRLALSSPSSSSSPLPPPP